MNRINNYIAITNERDALRWIQGYMLIQFVCQMALLIDVLGPVRTLFRMMTFTSSLAMILLLQGHSKSYPIQKWAIAALGVLTMGLLHPQLNTPLAGLAQIGLYFAVFAPTLWVSKLAITPTILQRMILILWLIHTASATMGVLQIYFPGRFTPSSQFVENIGGVNAEGLKIQLNNGDSVYRPMGLTDTPGGAASAGMYAFLFGMGFFASQSHFMIRLLSVLSMSVGLFVIYLCQIRSLVVMSLIAFVVYAVVLFLRSQIQRLAGVLIVIPLIVAASFFWALSVGRDAVWSRLSTLTDDRTVVVYQNSRGKFLEQTLEVEIWEKPFGAGLGRYGMMLFYFGDRSSFNSPPLWVEIMITGWTYDGGMPMVFVGYGSLIMCCVYCLQVAIRSRHPTVRNWATVVLAYNTGSIALTFNYPLFISQAGMEFWMINAAVFVAGHYKRPGVYDENLTG